MKRGEKRNNWTLEEINILLKCVNSSPNNKLGYEKAAKKLNRTVYACHNRHRRVIESQSTDKDSVRTWSSWSEKDLKILATEVKKSPNNLHTAFIRTANKIGKSEYAVQNRWYKYSNSPILSSCFMTISSKTKNINRKVVTDRTSDNTERSTTKIWNAIKALFKVKK